MRFTELYLSQVTVDDFRKNARGELGTRTATLDRDGIKKHEFADIGYERRNGYRWYGTWPQALLEIDYPKWKKGFGK